MPMDRKRYPKDWTQISNYIRFERAKGKCEECGIPHGAYRERDGDRFVTWDGLQEVDDIEFDLEDAVLIVLTTAHLGIDKPDGTAGDKRDTMDCRPENLAALCQRCHLNFDREQHVQNRYHNRRARLVEAGQQEMFRDAST